MAGIAGSHNQTHGSAQTAYEAEATELQTVDPVDLIGSILKIPEHASPRSSSPHVSRNVVCSTSAWGLSPKTPVVDRDKDKGTDTAAAVLVAKALSAADIPRHMYSTLLQALQDEGLVHEFVKSCREHLSDSPDDKATGSAVSPAAGGAPQQYALIATLTALLAALFAAVIIYE